MAEQPQGPIDTIPKANYLPLLTAANYLSTKQMINQVLSEDQEYVSWKLKEMRTGGTMNSFIDTTKYRFSKRDSNDNNNCGGRLLHSGGKVRKPSRKGTKSKVGLNGDENSGYNTEFISGVPKDLTFVRDIYEQVHRDEVKRISRTGFYDDRGELSQQYGEEEKTEVRDDGNDNEKGESDPKLSYEEQFKLLVLNLDEEQTGRFEIFHRTALNKGQVKRLATTVCGQTISENIRVLLQAVGKVFAGEIIELAMDARQRWFVGQMVNAFDRRREIAVRLKKYLKKLTLLAEKTNSQTSGGGDGSTVTNSNVGKTNDNKNSKIKDSNNNSNNNDNDNDAKDESSTDKTVAKGISIDDSIAPDSDVAILDDSVNETESDFYYDDEESEMKDIKIGNRLLKSQKNTQEVRLGLITRYNRLVKEFNGIDVGVERFHNSPLLPEHVREAWRLYSLQGGNMPSRSWRQQGEGNGLMFR